MTKPKLLNRNFDSQNASGHPPTAAEHDAWFRAQVEAAIVEADDPATQWLSHDDVVEMSARWREKWRRGSTRQAD